MQHKIWDWIVAITFRIQSALNSTVFRKMTTWISVRLTSVSDEQSNSISISLRISLRYALCILKCTNFHVFRRFLRCEIWGSHTDAAEYSSLRECYEVSTGKYLQELRSVAFPLCSWASSLGQEIWIFFLIFPIIILCCILLARCGPTGTFAFLFPGISTLTLLFISYIQSLCTYYSRPRFHSFLL